MQHTLVAMVVAMVFSVFVLLLSAPAFISIGLIERYGPCWGERPSFAAQLRGFLFQVVSVLAGCAAMAFIWPWLPSVHPLWPGLALPLAILLSDCLQYWEHRVEHWLFWRFHAVHHATREMSSTSNVSHFTHQIMMTIIYGIPIDLICGDPMGHVPVIVAIYWWSALTHSPAKINIGPLRWIMVDNRMHRIHHSLEKQHFDKNFGGIFSLWDRLFGTMHWPLGDEWPASGVAGHMEITTVTDFLARPFCRRMSDHQLLP